MMGRVKQALHLLAVIIVGGAISVYVTDREPTQPNEERLN
jgi:hypothetical protein